ncbi:MAG: YggS family pyridoxal phosphate-dependent enzyme [Lachnospiraceae bacterium]|nr:YggS family pyridoxal phosphate-dependent enzyme [Lachnospiraceae bacterium]
MDLSENLRIVRERIGEAAQKSGRKAEDVTLIAVSKTKPIWMMEAFAALGQMVFGENHVQEIVEKYALHPEYEYHMIGHLQTNKVSKVVGKVKMIHSVDSLHLAEAISKEAQKKGIVQDILVEINVGNEESKYGFSFEEAPEMTLLISRLQGLFVRGFMCVAPFVADPEENRMLFRRMKELSVDMQKQKSDNICTEFLSMGMTNDYMTAIEEGATHVRIGTALFGPREYKGA